MALWTARLIFVLSSTAILSAQSGEVRQLPQSVIERRLRQYSDSNPIRESTVKKLFSEAGCSVLKEEPVHQSASPNVICTLQGTGDGVIVVGAHFDHVKIGDGVVDNWTGASLLPSLYESLSSKPRKHTFVFVSFTDEEKGFVGSRAYVAGLGQEALARIRCMVDLDTLGLGPTEVWAHNSDSGLVQQLYSTASALGLPAIEMNVDGAGDSDGRSFKNHNIPIITLHSVTDQTMQILHTEKDNLSAIKLDDYYGSYRLISAYLALLDAELGVGPR